MITEVGLTKLAANFAADITTGQWGTGTAVPTPSDTSLGSALSVTSLTLTSTSAGNAAQFTHTTPSTTANGYDLTEFEIMFADTTMFSRNLFGPISKTASFEVDTLITVNFIRS